MLAEHNSRAGRQIQGQALNSEWSIERIGLCEVLYLFVDIAKSTECRIIGAEHG